MTAPVTPFVFRNRLLPQGLHFDFLRLRCGSEERFGSEIRRIRCDGSSRPRRFIAFSEWDAVVIMPCTRLYPDELNAIYGTPAIASTVAGSSGYFAYLWNHAVNEDLEAKLDRFERGGAGLIVALRFEEWYRNEFGLGGELLFCDFLQREAASAGLSAIVAHTLGWNDVVVVIHTDGDERTLTSLLSRLRVAVAKDLVSSADAAMLGARGDATILAASYTHLIAPFDKFVEGTLALGKITKEIASATLLVRVSPAREEEVRKQLAKLTKKLLGKTAGKTPIPNEMGHYSFSVDISKLVKRGDGRDAVKLIADARKYIGETEHETASSYPETSTILRFRESLRNGRRQSIASGAENEIRKVTKLMSKLVPRMRDPYGASPMSIHRFAAVLTTLLDHLSDPVRSSVVRHMARFIASWARIVPTLRREQLEDFCHICEYAMMQATDGIVQFQHDANSLGLTGRGGYSRLIQATETYVQDVMDAMQLEKNVLITFGLRTGHVGVSGQFQIDVPFNILFVPSRWYVLLHEAGHIIWVELFGWMYENLALFEELAREIRLTYRHQMTDQKIEHFARVEFIRTREIIRELFPNLLVWQVACRGDLAEFDRLSLTHILSPSQAGTRELLVAIVLHALFEVIQGAETEKGRNWWRTWTELDEKTLTRVVGNASEAMRHALRAAESAAASKGHVSIGRTIKLLLSQPFKDAVREAMQSVVKALSIRAKDFSRSRGVPIELQEEMFIRVQKSLEQMFEEQQTYGWDSNFADWMKEGEVLTVAPNGYVWTGLLLDERIEKFRHSGSPGTYMVSQLSPILSLWHRGVTGGVTPDERDRAKELLFKLGIVMPKRITSPRTPSPSPGTATISLPAKGTRVRGGSSRGRTSRQ